MQDRQGKRYLSKAIDELAHHIGALVTKKQTGQHLHLEIGTQRCFAEHQAEGLRHPLGITRQIIKWHAKIEIEQRLHERCSQGGRRRIVGAVTGAGLGFAVFNVLRAYRRPDKNKVIVEVGAVQNFGGD